MRSVPAHGGRWLWVPEEETDDSREVQVSGPACMSGVWVAYVNQGNGSTSLDVDSVHLSEGTVLSRPVNSPFPCVFVCFERINHAELSHVSRLVGQQVTHVNRVRKCLFIASFHLSLCDEVDFDEVVAGESTFFLSCMSVCDEFIWSDWYVTSLRVLFVLYATSTISPRLLIIFHCITLIVWIHWQKNVFFLIFIFTKVP